MHRAVLKVESPNAGVMFASLAPEAGRELPRTKVTVTGTDDTLTVVFDAADTTSMRAALNSYLGCIKITEDIERITGD